MNPAVLMLPKPATEVIPKLWRENVETRKGEKNMSEGDQLCLGAEFIHKAIMRFNDLAIEYLEYSKVHKSPKSYTRDELTIKHLMPLFAEKRLIAITTKDVEFFQLARAQKIKPNSVNREMETLRHMLNKSVDWGYIKVNPARRVKQLKAPPGRVRYLSEEERDRLLDECLKNRMLFAVVMTALETGMRAGEIRGLTWADVNLKQRTIILLRTKNNELRVVPVSNRLMPILEALNHHRNGSRYVFTKPDGTQYRSWRTAFENALKRAGIEDFRFHDLRHTFASHMVMSGVDIRTVQELLGHKDIKMTMRYSHLSKKHLLDAVNGTFGVADTVSQKEKGRCSSVVEQLFRKELSPKPTSGLPKKLTISQSSDEGNSVGESCSPDAFTVNVPVYALADWDVSFTQGGNNVGEERTQAYHPGPERL